MTALAAARPVRFEPVDLGDYVAAFRRRWRIIALCALVGLGLSAALVATTPARYRASARLFVNIPAARGVQEALQGVQLSQQLLGSYARVAESRTNAARVSDRLEGQLTAEEVKRAVRAEVEPATLLLTVTATDLEPVTARDVANAAAEVLIDRIAELESGKADQIEARVVDPAVTPSQPQRGARGLVLGGGLGLGLAVGLVLAMVREALDRTVSTPEQVTSAAGAPLLAVVPRARLRGGPVVTDDARGAPAGEAFRSLRAAIRFSDADRTMRSLLVTSPGPGDGKTTTAMNLALAFAQSGDEVVLVDADLRRGRLASAFGVVPDAGLVSVLSRQATLDTALVRLQPRLQLLGTGPLPPNPSELLGSQAFVDLLSELTARVDVVVIDSAPVVPVADAEVLAAQADGVVLVVRAGSTHRGPVEEAVMRIDRVGGSLLGTVLNGATRAGRQGYYTYGRSRRDQAARR